MRNSILRDYVEEKDLVKYKRTKSPQTSDNEIDVMSKLGSVFEKIRSDHDIKGVNGNYFNFFSIIKQLINVHNFTHFLTYFQREKPPNMIGIFCRDRNYSPRQINSQKRIWWREWMMSTSTFWI